MNALLTVPISYKVTKLLYRSLPSNCLFFSCSNKRAVQGGRLSAITMALQYGSESEEDAALAGRH